MGDEVLCVSLLGTFSVSLSGDAVPDDAWRLRKAKTLVKLLALAPERRLHAEQAAELLWADRDQASARNNLHQAIFAARRALDSLGLEGGRLPGAAARTWSRSARDDPVRVDVVAFERGRRERARASATRPPTGRRSTPTTASCCPRTATRSGPPRAATRCTSCASRWGSSWPSSRRPADPAAAIGRLRAVLVEEPLHEPAHRALMRLYVGGGRRQEALAQFQQLARAAARVRGRARRRDPPPLPGDAHAEPERSRSAAAATRRRGHGHPRSCRSS